jgi:hypothetical protein
VSPRRDRGAASRDQAVASVLAELDGLVADLRANVDALTAILTSQAQEARDD